MVTSTNHTLPVQPHSIPTVEGRLYIATSGEDLVETGLTLDWITHAIEERCRQTGEDVALWLVQAGASPWLVAAFRPAPQGRVSVQWL